MPAQDRRLPADWWDTCERTGLGATHRLALLYLYACCDRDGRAVVDTAALAKATTVAVPGHAGADGDLWLALDQLACTGVLAWRRDGLSVVAWLPDAPGWHGRGTLCPPARRAAPSLDAERVRACLAVRRGCLPADVPESDVTAITRARRTRARAAPDDDVGRVWEAWRRRQHAPDRCILSDPVRGLIAGALASTSAADLVLLVQYAYEADEPGPRYWRGENERGATYLGLDNLLRAGKLPGRLQLALAWRARGYHTEAEAALEAGFSRSSG